MPGEQGAVPLVLLVGSNDEIVGPVEAGTTVAAACALGTTTSMQLFPGVNHDGILSAGAAAARAWLDDRLAGIPAPSDC